jgi:TolB-like protein/DNA-binding response OmpR family regulator/Flp pilus assembly protein TadD
MRTQIMVIGRDAAFRARLAQLLSNGGFRPEVAESFVHARRTGLEGIALAIVAVDGRDASDAAAVEEIRAAVGQVLMVASPGTTRSSASDVFDLADEAGLLARIAGALSPQAAEDEPELILEFAGYLLDFAGHSLTDPTGKAIPLTQGEFGLLKAFAERPGRVLSRDRLMQLTAGRDAEAYDRSVDIKIGRLRRKIEPDPKHPSIIVTVPGRGYKFAAAVRRATASPPTRPQEGGDPTRATEQHTSALSAQTPIGTPAKPGAPERSQPPRLSILVLPFVNIGGGPDQDYFADGVTETLTTDLSRVSGAFVVGRSTAFTYKGKPLDLKQTGRELNVRYILEGSVQRGGNRLRINVQLVEAETGARIWAERFDNPLSDLLDMQDEIVSRLARQLDVELIAAEARRAELSHHPDATDLYYRGKASLNKGLTPENLSAAREFFQRSLALEPGNIEAQVGIAAVDVMAANTYQVKDTRSRLAIAEKLLIDVLHSAPGHAYAHFLLGMALTLTSRPERGLAECERALALDPNLAAARAFIGLAKLRIGRVEETEADVRAALRISPRDQDAFLWISHLGTAKLYLGRFDEAVEWYRRSQEHNRNHPLVFFYNGAALALAGRLEEARAEVREGLKRAPDFTVRSWHAGTLSDNPVYLAQRERLYEGMLKAGVPEE